MKPRPEARAASRCADAVILFTAGENEFAIAAAAVDEIRNTDGIREFAAGCGNCPKVSHTLARDGKTYFVVDASTQFNLLPSKKARLLVLRDWPVAVLVTHIDRMGEVSKLHPLPRVFQGAERKWFRGLMLVGQAPAETVVPLVDPEAFLTRREAEELAGNGTGANRP
jgi:chemotaxis signal transduction protein